MVGLAQQFLTQVAQGWRIIIIIVNTIITIIIIIVNTIIIIIIIDHHQDHHHDDYHLLRREEEVDGADYHFISRLQFEQDILARFSTQSSLS